MVRLQARSAFLIALAYVLVGALRWHHPLGGSADLLARLAAGVGVVGNLLWLLLVALSLPLMRWPRLALGLPTALVATCAVTGELAVGWNVDLPFYVGPGDPERLITLARGLAYALPLGIAAGLLASCAAKATHPGRVRRWPTILLALQGCCTLALVGGNAAGLRALPLEAVEGSARSPGVQRKLTIFCIDAGLWTMVDHFIDEGRMPHLAALKERGSYGHLMTHGRRLSPVVWTSMVTGMAEAGHGIHDFTVLSDDGEGRSLPTPSTERTAAAVWNIADAAGLKSLVHNWLVTAPAEEIGGVVVPNLKSALGGSIPATHPAAVRSLVADALDDSPDERPEDAYADITRLLEIEIDAWEAVRELADFDLVVTGTQASDSSLHLRYLDTFPELFDLEAWGADTQRAAQRSNDVPAIFTRIDEWLGALTAEGRAVLVVSDHGARPRAVPLVLFHADALLADMGLIAFEGERLEGSALDPKRARAREAGSSATRHRVEILFREEVTEGVEPMSLAEVIAALAALTVTETGEPLFEAAGPMPEGRRPEAFVIPAPCLSRPPGEVSVEVAGVERPLARYLDVRSENSGNHDPHGMFLFAAPDVEPVGPVAALCSETSLSTLLGFTLGTSRTLDRVAEAARRLGLFEPYTSLDVTPTALAYLGLPLARDMHGRVMERVLGPTPRARAGVDTHGGLLDPDRRSAPIDEAARAEILEQLRALGYTK
ncbi:MAG: hypothetical protein CMJ84_14705 [Planctomycetes bacterium]|jgi:hypothetical protein|nr:hypothetical protein [Planctomycetota bacterium]MDP6409317.1 alkaline phosphatase family protein [Planctomycetota bacterium]